MTRPLPLPIFACFCTATFFCGGGPWSAPVAAATPNAARAAVASKPTMATLLGERLNDNFMFRFLSLAEARRGNKTAGRWNSGQTSARTRERNLGNARARHDGAATRTTERSDGPRADACNDWIRFRNRLRP